MSSVTLDGLLIEVLTDPAEFDAMAQAWRGLYRRSPRATPFQTHGWLSAYAHAYGGHDGLRVALVRNAADGLLLAAAPLVLRRRGGVRVLTTLGGAITDYSDVLVAERDRESDGVDAAVIALARSLRDLPGWDVLDLPEVRPGAAAELLAGRWPGPCWAVGSSTCMELPVSSFDDLLGRLSGKRAGDMRRRLRRADALAIEADRVPVDDVDRALRDLIRLHGRQWEGRGGNPEHRRERFFAHLHAALGAMIADGSAVLTRYRLDGEVVAATLGLLGDDMACGYLMGVAPELYEKIDVTTFVLRDELTGMRERGQSRFSMLRGREPHKDRWRPDVVPNQRLVLGRPGSALARPYAAGVQAHARAVAVARERAPWLREVRARMKALRPA